MLGIRGAIDGALDALSPREAKVLQCVSSSLPHRAVR